MHTGKFVQKLFSSKRIQSLTSLQCANMLFYWFKKTISPYKIVYSLISITIHIEKSVYIVKYLIVIHQRLQGYYKKYKSCQRNKILCKIFVLHAYSFNKTCIVNSSS